VGEGDREGQDGEGEHGGTEIRALAHRAWRAASASIGTAAQ